MSVAEQARYPQSVLCRFLDRCLPLRAVIAEDWAGRAASAPWTGVYLPDAESRQRIGVAAEMRIGLDLGETPAYSDLLSFLPPAEYSALLGAAHSVTGPFRSADTSFSRSGPVPRECAVKAGLATRLPTGLPTCGRRIWRTADDRSPVSAVAG